MPAQAAGMEQSWDCRPRAVAEITLYAEDRFNVTAIARAVRRDQATSKFTFQSKKNKCESSFKNNKMGKEFE